MKNTEHLRYEIKAREFTSYPPEWETVFERRAPVLTEIGCGNGEFLADWALRYPDKNFIGIERSLESARRTQKRLWEQGIPNVRIIRDDARFAMRELFPDNSLQQVMVNFPDPWPKDRHRNRRIVIPDFIRTLSAVLSNHGVFELVSDQEWFIKEAFGLFADTRCFRMENVETNPIREVSTKYERKWREEGRTVYRFRAVKEQSSKIHRIVESGEMPHVIIEKKIHPDAVYNLKALSRAEGDQIFIVKEIFARPDQEAFLLRTVTTDQGYTQNFFILIATHPSGYIVKIDSGFQPYRTPAVKAAIRKVGQLLSE